MRFGCRSFDLSASSVAGPSKVDKLTNSRHNDQPETRHKRSQAPIFRAAKAQDVVEAKRKDEKLKKLKQLKQPRPRIMTHVYIGNLDPSITEGRLEQHFAACGKIQRTTLRISSGQAINVGVPIPPSKRTMRDHKYASMEFFHPAGSLHALRLNGSDLDGVKLVVSASAGDLPEVADIAKPHIQNIKAGRQPSPMMTRSRAKAQKALSRTDTEPDFSDPRNDEIRVLGSSFDECIIWESP